MGKSEKSAQLDVLMYRGTEVREGVNTRNGNTRIWDLRFNSSCTTSRQDNLRKVPSPLLASA